MIVIEELINTLSGTFNGNPLDQSAIFDTITTYCFLYSSNAIAFELSPKEKISGDFCVGFNILS